MRTQRVSKRSIAVLIGSCLIVVATSSPQATTSNFPGFVADPTTWGVNVFLDTLPFFYGTIGLGTSPFYRPMVTSVFDTKADTNGTRSARAVLTPSNFDLGVLATTSKRGAFVQAAAVATTGYVVSEPVAPGASIPGTATIHGTFRGTANQGGLVLQFFLADYHEMSAPRDQSKYRTYVEVLVDTRSTTPGRTPLGWDKVSCLFVPPAFQPQPPAVYTACPIDVTQDANYGDFTVTVPFRLAPDTGNGIVAELYGSAFSSGGEEETVDFLATASLSLDPPAGTIVTLATGQTFGAPSDNTPPTTTASVSPAPNASGWNDSDVTVALTSTDEAAGSGVKEIHYSLAGAQNGSGVVAGTVASIPITAEGVGFLTYFAVDNAGNREAPRTLAIRIDKTPPIVVVTRTPPPNANGWNNSSVTAHFAATDALSGIAGAIAADVTFDQDGANQQATRTFTDLAGNSVTAQIDHVNIDTTPPTIGCTATPNVLWPPNHQQIPVTLAVQVADLSSGPAGFVVMSATSNETDPGSIQGFTTATPTSGTLRAWRFGNGSGRVYSLGYTGFDLAGNRASCTATISVPHDQSGVK